MKSRAALVSTLVFLASVSMATHGVPNQAATPLAATSTRALTPRILAASTTVTTAKKDGQVNLAVRGEGVARYRLSATCPEQVSLKIGSSNLCNTSLLRTQSNLARQRMTLRNPAYATGTVAITARIVEPKVAVSTSTERTVNIKLAPPSR